MSRTLRLLVAAAVLAVAVPAAAQAAPADDAAEGSQTIQVAWLMPGPFTGYARFPQTYLPGGVPECGDGGVQVDVYKYGTPEVQAFVDALLARGVLTSPADDARASFAPRVYWFVELVPCVTIDPGNPPGPVDPGDPGDPGDPIEPSQSPSALPARPLTAAPTYAG